MDTLATAGAFVIQLAIDVRSIVLLSEKTPAAEKDLEEFLSMVVEFGRRSIAERPALLTEIPSDPETVPSDAEIVAEPAE